MHHRINDTSLNPNNIKDDSIGTTLEAKAIADTILEWHNSETFTFQTSGSTGPPKHIIFSKEQVIASIDQSRNAFNLSENDVALLSLPMKYVAGKMMLFRALHIGMNIITVEPKMDLSIDFDSMQVSFAAMIPIQIENILKSKKGRLWLSTIRVILIGGGPISTALENELKAFENEIYHTYGMTETLTHIAVRLLSKNGNAHYTTLPNIEINKSKDSTLIIKAHHLDTTLTSNDIVEINSSGNFKILGRIDNVINSGGLKVNPEELEAIFIKYIDNAVICIGIKDDTLGEKVVGVIEKGSKIDREWINIAIAEIPKAKRPKSLVFVDAFPRTESGKIIRKNVVTLISPLT